MGKERGSSPGILEPFPLLRYSRPRSLALTLPQCLKFSPDPLPMPSSLKVASSRQPSMETQWSCLVWVSIPSRVRG